VLRNALLCSFNKSLMILYVLRGSKKNAVVVQNYLLFGARHARRKHRIGGAMALARLS
jgi:hypothetical protein